MSDNTEQVEQITKVPSVAPKREKDPKRVAAGKKLAESNKLMREEHARYKAEEAQRVSEVSQQVHEAPESLETETNDSSLSDGFLSQLTLGNVLSLLGVGLSIYALFFKGETKANDTWRGAVETTLERPEPKQQPKEEVKPKPKPGTKPRPRFGM